MASSLGDTELHPDGVVDDEPAMVLAKTWVVRVKGPNKTWVPEIMDKFGLLFIRLQKFDRQLTQFVLGKCMDMRAGKNISCNTTSFDHLLDLRKKASIEAVEHALQVQNDDSEKNLGPPPKKKGCERGRQRCFALTMDLRGASTSPRLGWGNTWATHVQGFVWIERS